MSMIEETAAVLGDELVLLAASDTWERMHAPGHPTPVQSYLDEGGGVERLPKTQRSTKTPRSTRVVSNHPVTGIMQAELELERMSDPEEGLVLQSVSFPKDHRQDLAKSWLAQQGYTVKKVDTRGYMARYRIEDPNNFELDSYVTKTFELEGSTARTPRTVRLTFAKRR